MPAPNGQFVWLDLMTGDADAAAAFYGAVAGWTAHAAPAPNDTYRIISADGVGVGGIVTLSQADRDAGASNGWLGYIWADDVDAMAARVKNAGGSIHRAATNIPEVGRFAVASDPQGALFALFRAMVPTPSPPPPAGNTPGRIGWHELHASDLDLAFAFYADLFGWTRADAVDMGPMGLYQMFAAGHGPVGGMMRRADATQPPGWLHYINVADIDAAIGRVIKAGGTVVSGPNAITGGSQIAQCLDVQGTVFAMVTPPGT